MKYYNDGGEPVNMQENDDDDDDVGELVDIQYDDDELDLAKVQDPTVKSQRSRRRSRRRRYRRKYNRRFRRRRSYRQRHNKDSDC